MLADSSRIEIFIGSFHYARDPVQVGEVEAGNHIGGARHKISQKLNRFLRAWSLLKSR